MLEILAILFLSNKNAKNAAARGRKPGGFRGLTFGLWFGGELLGFLLGMTQTDGDPLASYGGALVLAVIGGVASYLIAKNCKPGDHTQQQHAPLAGARPLDVPCGITITREKSLVGAAVSYSVYVNGRHAGDLKNGGSLRAATSLVQNIVVAKDAYGTEIKPICFAVPSGGEARIVFGPQRFLTDRCGSIMLLDEANLLALAQNAPEQFSANVPQTPSGHPFPLHGTAQTANMPERPMRAVWVMGGAILFILLSALTYLPKLDSGIDTPLELMAFCFPLALGACVCLMLKGGAKYKILSGAGLILVSWVYAFAFMYLILHISFPEDLSVLDVLREPGVGGNFRAHATISLVVGAIALIVSCAHTGSTGRKLTLSAWLGAAAFFLIRLFNARNAFLDPDREVLQKVVLFTQLAGDAVCLAVMARLVNALCALPDGRLRTGTGAKIWFCVCVAFTTGNIVLGFVTQTMGIAAALAVLPGICGYALLLMSKREGYVILLMAALINTAAGVSIALTTGEPSAADALLALTGLINPLITWLVIRRAWNDPANAGAPRHGIESASGI